MSYQRLNEISDDLITSIKDYTYARSELFLSLAPASKNVTILKGARGIGKSTLLLQFLLKKRDENNRVLYISADSTLIDKSLVELVHEYYKRGGEYLAIDEIHKYENWQAEVKTILDSFPNIKLIVSGSSSLSLDYATADLSRRHIMLHAKGLSFREYVNKNYALNIKKFPLSELLSLTEEITLEVAKKFRTLKLDLLEIFKMYLYEGYFLTRDNYPTVALYYDSLLNSINSVIDVDLQSIYRDIDGISKQNIKKLLRHIAVKCPFVPNISELSRNLSIANDNSLKKYLYYLSESEVLMNLYAANKSHKDFQKPQKIFLNNTNYCYAYYATPDLGTIRETFVANCLGECGDLTAPTFGDFCLNEDIVFEVGGRSKNKRQVSKIKNAYVFCDDIMSVEHDKIPLWLLGFLW